MAPAMRDLFRSTAMHNTVVLDGRPQSAPRGPFHWSSRADARCLVWHSELEFDYVEGIHDGYLPKAHARAVLALHGTGWLVIDHVLGPPGVSVTADTFWHIHPAWTLVRSDGTVLLRHTDGTTRSIACSSGLRALSPTEANGLDRYSPVYGRIEPALCLTSRTAAPVPHTVATFISGVNTSAVPVVEQLRVNVPPPAGWHGAAFSLRWRDGEAVVLSAIGSSLSCFRRAGSPGATWGCELATTDARTAVIPLGGDRRLKPMSDTRHAGRRPRGWPDPCIAHVSIGAPYSGCSMVKRRSDVWNSWIR